MTLRENVAGSKSSAQKVQESKRRVTIAKEREENVGSNFDAAEE